MFGLLIVVSYIKKIIEYFFTKIRLLSGIGILWYKNWVKIDNIFCFFMLIFGVSGYIFKKFCIYMCIALFIGNVPLRFYLRQLFISLHVFSYSSCKSIYLGFFSNFLILSQYLFSMAFNLRFLSNKVNGLCLSKKHVHLFDYFKD